MNQRTVEQQKRKLKNHNFYFMFKVKKKLIGFTIGETVETADDGSIVITYWVGPAEMGYKLKIYPKNMPEYFKKIS